MRLAVLIALAACGGRDAPPRARDAAPGRPAPAADAGPPILQVAPPRAVTGRAVRCSLEGAPLASDCSLDSIDLAIADDGAVHVSDTRGVRRYHVGAGAGCALALDAEIAQPVIEPKPQTLGSGGVYLSSGGPRWSLAAAAGAIYYFEYLRGVHRVDRGKLEPVCPDLQGVHEIAGVGKQVYVARDGVQLLGAKCQPKPSVVAQRSIGVYAAGGALWAEVDANHVARLDGNAIAATLGGDDHFAPGGLCAVTGLAACGDGVCVLDPNCQRLARFAIDGSFVAQLDWDALFTARPSSVHALAAGRDGALWLSASHQDGDACEGAIYRLTSLE